MKKYTRVLEWFMGVNWGAGELAKETHFGTLRTREKTVWADWQKKKKIRIRILYRKMEQQICWSEVDHLQHESKVYHGKN